MSEERSRRGAEGKTMAEIKSANFGLGQHFFEEATMGFLEMKIESEVFGAGYFVTSERPHNGERVYSIRQAMADGHIDTVKRGLSGEGYKVRETALQACEMLANGALTSELPMSDQEVERAERFESSAAMDRG